jgi:energy-coupling factor transporter ATP-binding protein EcfA2
MATISEVVDLKTGYANFVELKSAYAESQENADRMAMYRPTKAHRQAFERICRGLYQPNDKKFYLLSGSYGTGKSHLCLMLANFLSRSSGDPQIASFYENYSKLEPDTGKTLKNVRKDGRYLVVICDYHSGKRFEDVLLKEIFDACQAAGLDAGVSTEYDEAQRQLDDWQAKGTKAGIRDFYEDFNKALENLAPGMTVDALRAKLKDFDSDALELFRDVFKVVTGGVDFQAKSGNLIPIVRALVRSNGFKERFKGLAIFFDEFGFTLESASYSKDICKVSWRPYARTNQMFSS